MTAVCVGVQLPCLLYLQHEHVWGVLAAATALQAVFFLARPPARVSLRFIPGIFRRASSWVQCVRGCASCTQPEALPGSGVLHEKQSSAIPFYLLLFHALSPECNITMAQAEEGSWGVSIPAATVTNISYVAHKVEQSIWGGHCRRAPSE